MDFDIVIDRRDTESAKWNRYDADILPMWVADMDFSAPEPVIQALHERVAHGIFGYGSVPAGLREAICQHLAERQNWFIDAREISFISGVVTGFTHAIYSFTDPGDSILVQTPVYPPILVAPGATGRVCVQNELILCDDGRYKIDFDDFRTKIASGVKLFILCNPHNPVGRVFTREELTQMAEICLAHDVLICSDEIHSDLVFAGNNHIPIASLSSEIAEYTVTYFAPSKTFNLAGLSTSVYVVKNPKMRDRLSQSMKLLIGHPNILGLHAALAAYRDGGSWLDELLVYLQQNRDYLVEVVTKELPGLKIWAPEGTFLGWLDCRGLSLEEFPHSFFQEKAKVGLNDGESFGQPGIGFVRINFGCPRALLQQGLERMKSVL